MSVAAETFVKQFLSQVFDKTRSNGPGSGGSAGSGGGASWVTTHKYRTQLEKEEEAWLRGELLRDKSGLLPVEAKAASERGPLGMADMRTALEMGDCGIGQMPIVMEQTLFGYREGELEEWDEYSFLPGFEKVVQKDADQDVIMGGVSAPKINGYHDEQNEDGYGWEGAGHRDREALSNLLEACLA
jgi:transcriptional coactivator HFI1/ADA1